MQAMTNPWGYSRGVREEKGRDTNRDFPYRQKPEECMTTITG